MRRRLWIVSMALVALVAATGQSASAEQSRNCRAPGSKCTLGGDCCSVICTCSGGPDCFCD